MKKILLFLLLLGAGKSFIYAQNLSFNCPKDLVLGCGVNCVDLVTQFPDLKAIGDNYTVENVSTFKDCYPILSPGDPGPSTSLIIDDLYSSVIDLPFTFPFYGVPYNSVIASTNGYLSFDISNTGLFSHYDNFGDLPNAAYDNAIIMGPYHDLDPSVNTSPSQQIKYNVTGVAPNRKWVLSFFKVPLYGCNDLIENTHQIVLYETSGIIEVTIVSKQICMSSNQGRAMVGIQDFTKTKATMAPKRRMSDPPWGTKSMNETWRFTPVGGASLFKKIELLDGSGAVISTGDTTRVSATSLGWTFPNVCPPTDAPTLYVVKTTFAKLSDPAGINYSLDTIRVKRNAIPVSATTGSTQCGTSNGSISVTASGGTAPYTYALDAGPAQASNVFTNLAAGSYMVTVADATGCKNTVTAVVTVVGNLPATTSFSNASCPGVSNGSITVTPTSGTAPFTYSANGGPSQVSNVFSNLAPGTYTILFTDAAGCNGTISQIISPGSNINGGATVVATTCPGVNNGSITVSGFGGVAPYTYSIDGGVTYQASNVFTGLSPKDYLVEVKDSRGCIFNVLKTVDEGSGINTVVAVTNGTCAISSNGSIEVTPLNGTAPYAYTLDGGTPQAGNIFNNLADGDHTVLVSDANGCKVDITRTIVSTGLDASAATSQASCPTSTDGTITVITTNGTTPFTYVLDGGTPQTSNIFNAVGTGMHSIKVVDAKLCSTTFNTFVGAGPYLPSTFATTNAVCANINDGVVTINPTGVAPFSYTLNPIAVTQASATFTNLAPGAYTYTFSDATGCTGTGSFTITSNPALKTPSVKTMPLCNGNNSGKIIFNPAGGVAPYQYALSPFTNYQISNTFANLIAGSYLFRIKDKEGCTKDTTIVLAQPPVLNAAAVSNTPATCNGNDGIITINANGGTAPYQYSLNNGTTYSPLNTLVAPSVGTFANIKIKDANGCITNTTATVAYIDTMRLALNNVPAICAGTSITLQPETNNETTGFVWTSANAPISSLNNPNIKNPVASPSDTATYRLMATWGLCSRQADITINVLRKPIPDAGKDTSICFGAEAVLRGNATNLSGTVSYDWSPAGNILTPTDPVTVVQPAGNGKFVYTLTVRDNYNCNFVITDAVAITVYPKVVAFAGNDTIAVKGIPHQLFGSGGSTYLWSPSADLNTATAQNPRATLNNDTRFFLQVKDAIGCTDTSSVFVKVYDGPTYYVPNAFTPNGDGRNDVFRATPVGIIATDWFRIFDRYGHLVFETSQYLKGWDGTYKGQRQPMGTYVWVIKGIDRNRKTVEQKGSVILIR